MKKLLLVTVCTLAMIGPSKSEKWGAIAIGVNELGVASGDTHNADSEEAAKKISLERCNGKFRPFRLTVDEGCTVGTTFNHGCGYVAIGQGGGNMSVGAGPTRQVAKAKCSAHGATCTKISGGCVEDRKDAW
jgi:hypothetical protein